jgi:hypothetical protein
VQVRVTCDSDQGISASRSGMWGMDWVDMTQDRGRWRAVVNAVMNLGVP